MSHLCLTLSNMFLKLSKILRASRSHAKTGLFLKLFRIFFLTCFLKLLQPLLVSILARFWLGLQKRRKRYGKTEDDIKLKTEAPLQRNTRFCSPTRLQNRFKNMLETNFFQRSSWKLKNFRKCRQHESNLASTWTPKYKT